MVELIEGQKHVIEDGSTCDMSGRERQVMRIPFFGFVAPYVVRWGNIFEEGFAHGRTDRKRLLRDSEASITAWTLTWRRSRRRRGLEGILLNGVGSARV